MKEFLIHFGEEQIENLRQRISYTRWPGVTPFKDWCLGTDSDYLQALLRYWRDEYDWSRRERELNQYPQFTYELDGTTVHFFHIPASRKGGASLAADARLA